MTIERAKKVLLIEADAVRALADRLGEEFLRAIEILKNCSGKVVVTGMGKSGLVCQKIAATFASTGTPAFFLHPAEGLHGDLGMVSKGDVVLALSNSGETEEILKLLPYFRRLSLPLIAMVGRRESTLAKNADVVLDVSVKEEACPYNLVPTASTTAMLAMGDALALALLEERGFKPEDFALRHPAGSLGKRLLLRVADLMHTGEQIPIVSPDASMKEVIFSVFKFIKRFVKSKNRNLLHFFDTYTKRLPLLIHLAKPNFSRIPPVIEKTQGPCENSLGNRCFNMRESNPFSKFS